VLGEISSKKMITRSSRKKNSFKKGDLLIDQDVFGDDLADLALVLETPEDKGYYKVYYCTGPVAGDIVLESPHAMENFKTVSFGGIK
jgi:hypothetical protein